MKDFAGNELEEGQRVICLTAGASSSWMIWGTVVGFTPQKVKVKIRRSYGNFEDVTLRDPERVVIPLTPELQDFVQAEQLRQNLTIGEDLTYSPE